MDSIHYRNPTSLHKRDPVEDEESINYEEINNSHKSANIRGIQDEKFLEKLHNPVTFNWSQFWVTFLYENLPPVIFSPIAAILIERNKKQAWNVIQNRMLLIFSLAIESISSVISISFFPITTFFFCKIKLIEFFLA